VAVLVNPANATTAASTVRDVAPAARTMGLQILVFETSTSREIDAAFDTFVRERPDALFVDPDPFLLSRRVQLVHLATRHALPASYGTREFAEIGGLMSYGPSLLHGFRVLNGTKPATGIDTELTSPPLQTKRRRLATASGNIRHMPLLR